MVAGASDITVNDGGVYVTHGQHTYNFGHGQGLRNYTLAEVLQPAYLAQMTIHDVVMVIGLCVLKNCFCFRVAYRLPSSDKLTKNRPGFHCEQPCMAEDTVEFN